MPAWGTENIVVVFAKRGIREMKKVVKSVGCIGTICILSRVARHTI